VALAKNHEKPFVKFENGVIKIWSQTPY